MTGGFPLPLASQRLLTVLIPHREGMTFLQLLTANISRFVLIPHREGMTTIPDGSKRSIVTTDWVLIPHREGMTSRVQCRQRLHGDLCLLVLIPHREGMT